MIPIKDTIHSKSFPVVTWLLVIVNVLVFVLIELPLGQSRLNQLIATYGITPSQCAAPILKGFSIASIPGVGVLFGGCAIPLITSMFLHGGWLHIIGNMWVLLIFGDNVEDRMGSIPYFIFYMICGVVSGLTQAFIAPTSQVPAIGASGAIAGVLAAYLVFYPRARVVTLIPIIIIPWFVNIPALIFILIWFLLQFFSGLSALGGAASGGVAYWAHVGGFICGLLLVWFFGGRSRNRPQAYPDEYHPW
ncbi:MAG TPA: rhomboid family intramembrane serine protease [Anaerolineales bacterium]